MPSLSLIIAIIIAGVVGFLATAVAVRAMMNVPISMMFKAYGKILWSVIFAIPLLFLTTGLGQIVGLIITYLCLSVAPTVASKLYFGPKDRPFFQLMIFNSIYAVAAILTFLAIIHLV